MPSRPLDKFTFGEMQFRILQSFLQVYIVVTQLTNSVASVREQTIPTERPPLVGEVSANYNTKNLTHQNKRFVFKLASSKSKDVILHYLALLWCL
jgi:hypothetical protein